MFRCRKCKSMLSYHLKIARKNPLLRAMRSGLLIIIIRVFRDFTETALQFFMKLLDLIDSDLNLIAFFKYWWRNYGFWVIDVIAIIEQWLVSETSSNEKIYWVQTLRNSRQKIVVLLYFHFNLVRRLEAKVELIKWKLFWVVFFFTFFLKKIFCQNI